MLKQVAALGVLCGISVAQASVPAQNSIGLETSGFLFAPPQLGSGAFTALNAHLAGRRADPSEDLEFQGSASALLHASGGRFSPFFEVQEAFVATSPKVSQVSIALGRRLESWNQLDENWGLGIWQPRFRWDYLHPESVGMTGGFLRAESENFRVVGFWSPLFIPERGMQIWVQDGSIVSSSPWFLAPPSEIRLINGVKTPVRYSIEVPSLKSIVLRSNESFMIQGGAIRAGQTGLWGSVAYARKPINQLLMAYWGYLGHEEVGQQNAQAFIYPRVLEHRVTSFEAGYKHQDIQGSVSVLSDRPIRDVTPAEWTTQEVSPALAWSPSIAFKVPYLADAGMRLSYLRVVGGTAPDGGMDPSKGSVFDSRYPFERAVCASFNASVRLPRSLGTQGTISTKFTRDIGQSGTILSAQLGVMPTSSISFRVGADLIGTEKPASTGFVSRYQANDRFYAGVSYVF